MTLEDRCNFFASHIYNTLGSMFEDHRLIHVGPRIVNKLVDFIRYGPEYMQVVCDFDHTLSKCIHNSEKVPVCHELFMKNPRIPEISRLRLKELHDFYVPLETSCDIYECEKLSLMMEFWKLAHKALVDGNVSRNDIDGCVLEGGIVLRNNATDFVNKLAQLSIPLVIFSGGIGNVIETVLTSSGVSLENVRVVSNFMDFNPEGRLVGFQDPVIHSLNKVYNVIQNSEYFETVLSKRICILLVGDSTSDAKMIDDMEKFSYEQVIVIRIGFLNEKNDKKVELFSSLYDLVLLNDETFDIPLFILSSIVNSNELCKHESSNKTSNIR
uniref:5'-nucleotidase n=1 Tax=Schistosoma mansoni TaxID=6183 RepID=A0A5K4FBW1_SCHMA